MAGGACCAGIAGWAGWAGITGWMGVVEGGRCTGIAG
jgi:hypothetical protein